MSQTKKNLKKSFDEFSDLLILKVIFDNLKDEKRNRSLSPYLKGKSRETLTPF